MTARHGERPAVDEPDPLPVTVRAAGTVLWRPAAAGKVEVCLVHRPHRADWSLPKGKFERGETAAACAARETWEETGYLPVLGRPLGDVDYALPGSATGHKVVTYFAGRAGDGAFTPNHEVDELRWLRPGKAAELLSYQTDRDVLARFTALPAATRTVLLVRHAKAGNRSGWSGPDAQRPLGPAGSEQAAALRAMLPLFGPVRVFAAAKVRCVDTVAGVAADLGLPVLTEPSLAEESYRGAAQPTIRRLAGIIEDDGVPLICGQGGVIPGVLRELATRSGLTLDRIPCKKGSTWVLSFNPAASSAFPAALGGTFAAAVDVAEPLSLLAADYIPTALPNPILTPVPEPPASR